MSNILQILTKRGVYANVPPGRRVRIDPELRAPSDRMSPVPLGSPDFQVTDNPPLAPDEVSISTGFEVTDIVSDPNSAYFGCFYAQNMQENIADMEWEATWRFTKQLDPNQAEQSDVGPRGEDGGSAQGVDPIAIQGYNILYANEVAAGAVPDPDGVQASVWLANIEEVNRKSLTTFNNINPPYVKYPFLTQDQGNIEFVARSQTNVSVTSYPAQGQTLLGFADYTLGDTSPVLIPNFIRSALTYLFNYPGQDLTAKAHYHYPFYVAPPSE